MSLHFGEETHEGSTLSRTPSTPVLIGSSFRIVQPRTFSLARSGVVADNDL